MRGKLRKSTDMNQAVALKLSPTKACKIILGFPLTEACLAFQPSHALSVKVSHQSSRRD